MSSAKYKPLPGQENEVLELAREIYVRSASRCLVSGDAYRYRALLAIEAAETFFQAADEALDTWRGPHGPAYSYGSDASEIVAALKSIAKDAK